MDCAFVDDVPFIESIAPEIKLLKSLVIKKYKNARGIVPALGSQRV